MAKKTPMAFSAELLDELLDGQDPATVPRSDGLLGDLKKALAECHEEILALEAAGKNYLQYVLARYRGYKRSLARHLGLSERTLYRKLKLLEQRT